MRRHLSRMPQQWLLAKNSSRSIALEVSELEDHYRGRGAPFCIQSLQQPWYIGLLEAGSLEPPSLCMLEACHLGVCGEVAMFTKMIPGHGSSQSW